MSVEVILKDEWADEEVKAFLTKMMVKKPVHPKQLRGYYTLDKAYSNANASNNTLMQAPLKATTVYGLHTGIGKRRRQDSLKPSASVIFQTTQTCTLTPVLFLPHRPVGQPAVQKVRYSGQCAMDRHQSDRNPHHG